MGRKERGFRGVVRGVVRGGGYPVWLSLFFRSNRRLCLDQLNQLVGDVFVG